MARQGIVSVTTSCYMERDGAWLMLHRTKKKEDINEGKYLGVGGHIEHGESPEECIRREITEETGLIANSLRLRGILTFVCGDLDEFIFLYTCDDFSGTLKECNEGDLVWVPVEQVEQLPLWEGDRVFLRLLRSDCPFFSLKLTYDGDRLVDVQMDDSAK